MMWANDQAHETALIATMHDGSCEPKTYYEATQCNDLPNWWGAICTEFNNMEQQVVWEMLFQKEGRLEGPDGFLHEKWMADTDPYVLQKI
jgi:hypothetical protein